MKETNTKNEVGKKTKKSGRYLPLVEKGRPGFGSLLGGD